MQPSTPPITAKSTSGVAFLHNSMFAVPNHLGSHRVAHETNQIANDHPQSYHEPHHAGVGDH